MRVIPDSLSTYFFLRCYAHGVDAPLETPIWSYPVYTDFFSTHARRVSLRVFARRVVFLRFHHYDTDCATQPISVLLFFFCPYWILSVVRRHDNTW